MSLHIWRCSLSIFNTSCVAYVQQFYLQGTPRPFLPISSAMASRSGATEHAGGRSVNAEHFGTSSGKGRQNAWEGTLAFSNIGLPATGIRGRHWSNKHGPRLTRLVTELFEANAHDERPHQLLGILLNEVGNLSDLLDGECRDKFGDMMTNSFFSAAENEPQICWSPGETMAAFRSDINVKCLPQLANINRLSAYRTVDRFAVIGATEHGPCKLLVYNQHQPDSFDRPWPASMRIAFCSSIVRDAVDCCNNDPDFCGFVFGGDANCSIAPWQTAFQEVTGWHRTFQKPQFLHGVRRKTGDLMVAAAVHGFDMEIYENRCAVQGREKQHDCMFFKWSCLRSHAKAPAGPAARRVRPRILAANSNSLADSARGTREPARRAARRSSSASSSALEADQIEADETPEAHTLEADEVSSCCSIDFGTAPDSEATSTRADDDSASEHDSEAGAAEHADKEDIGLAKHFDELHALGFALAKSASLLREFSTLSGSRNCIDAAWMKPMTGACSEADREALNACLTNFFTRQKVLQSTHTKTPSDQARVLKSSTEIHDAWQLIFERRRLTERNDRQRIEDPHQLGDMWTAWQRDWFAKNLTPGQENKKWNKKTSIFNTWTWNTVGGKHFVMAVWQTGMTWAPSSDLVRKDFGGALKHVATHFASWTRKLARSVADHKADPRTEEARTRSGTSKGHGLNPQQVQDRAERTDARHNYYRILRLDHKFCASKGKGKD